LITLTSQAHSVRPTKTALWKYAWWALVGALLGLGVVGIMTIGLAFLMSAAVLGLIAAFTPTLRNRSVLGAVGGLAAAPLYLAWLNRGGPGRVCSTEGTTVSCVQEWSPWPFLAAALALVVGLLLLARWVRHR
jgi:hypothetical protein